MIDPRDNNSYKLLLLLPFPPRLDAAQGGSRVTAQLVTQLASRHRVALLYLQGSEDPVIDEAVTAACEWVEVVARPDYGGTIWGRWRRRIYFLLGMLLGRPMWVVEWSVPRFREALARRVQSWQPDIVQAEFHIMGQYLASLRKFSVRQVLTMHEPGVSGAPYLLGIYPKVGLFVHRFDAWAWRRYERALLRQVPEVVVFTKEDRQILEKYGEAATITVVKFGTDLSHAPMNPLGNEPPRLLFIGNFVHPPNIDAALRLVQTIFPEVLKRVPRCQLDLVGNWPPAILRHHANPQIHVTGYVPDVTPYLEHAAVFVAPLRMGGGMRVKVLEALAAGKAMVASSLALQGLDVVDGVHVLVANSDAEITDAIVDLLLNPVRRVAIAQQAHKWAAGHLDWEQALQSYGAIYEHLVEGRQPLQSPLPESGVPTDSFSKLSS